MKFSISQTIKDKVKDSSFLILTCKVKNSTSSDSLWTEIENFSIDLRNNFKLEDVNKRDAILSTRNIYKLCGKDPNRYRPAAESLCRRILKGLDLYKVNTVVDLINYISLYTGFSIGGFDLDKIVGDTITLGIGEKDEPYEGIGRGILNIEGMPVWRDSQGCFGTPTSDNERTKLDISTTNLLMIVNAYGCLENSLDYCKEFCVRLLEHYAEAKDVDIRILSTSI